MSPPPPRRTHNSAVKRTCRTPAQNPGKPQTPSTYLHALNFHATPLPPPQTIGVGFLLEALHTGSVGGSCGLLVGCKRPSSRGGKGAQAVGEGIGWVGGWVGPNTLGWHSHVSYLAHQINDIFPQSKASTFETGLFFCTVFQPRQLPLPKTHLNSVQGEEGPPPLLSGLGGHRPCKEARGPHPLAPAPPRPQILQELLE